ncbi:hypothetical protein HT576_22360 [Haloterrigena sp. SYSU A121-1]|uniref:Uncharacterized protein n=1 Tax=Haloterrigena gelatinilytica TaxID=2741724 RepID=A0A8J8GPZ8_9EURY|nr:hypothetical protein [Haloterrigena gelatinilytica]NUB93726.1 hypothetical protein [Haloterrigena gelatinilytica]
MHRRTLLASLPAGAVASIAGCADWTTAYHDITLEPVSHTEYANEMTKRADDLSPSPFIENIVSTLVNGESIELEVLGEFDVLNGRSTTADPYSIPFYRVVYPIFSLLRDISGNQLGRGWDSSDCTDEPTAYIQHAVPITV